MSRARVIVFGYGPLAVTGLRTLERLGALITAVVIPSNRSGADVAIVADYARSRGWTLLIQPRRADQAPFVETLRALAPDVLFVWSYSMLLSTEMLGTARLGGINLHSGLLPEYRGGHVMNWAIANGETETAATLHQIDAGIDTGAIIGIERVPIEADDDAASVRRRLEGAGERLLERWWPAIEAGTAPRMAQDESTARYWRMRTREDGRIDWSASSESIRNLVRALVPPWPGAFTSWGARTVTVRRCALSSDGAAAPPGTITDAGESGIAVRTGDGAVIITHLEIDGQAVTPKQGDAAGLSRGVVLG